MRHRRQLIVCSAVAFTLLSANAALAQDQPAEPPADAAPPTAPSKPSPAPPPAKAPDRPPGVWEEVPPEDPEADEDDEAQPDAGDAAPGPAVGAPQPAAAEPPPPGVYPTGPPPSGPPPGYYPPPSYGTAYAVPQKPPTQRNNTGMMVGGIVMSSVGGLALVIGAAIASSGENGDYTCRGELCSNIPDEDKRDVGIGIAVGGLALIGGGIPLIVIGARQVPIASPGDANHAPRARLLPTVEVGPTRGRLTWSF